MFFFFLSFSLSFIFNKKRRTIIDNTFSKKKMIIIYKIYTDNIRQNLLLYHWICRASLFPSFRGSVVVGQLVELASHIVRARPKWKHFGIPIKGEYVSFNCGFSQHTNNKRKKRKAGEQPGQIDMAWEGTKSYDHRLKR